jgi:hypothetical protein
MRPYIIGILACIACPPAAVLVIPTLLMLLVLQLVCGSVQAAAMASSRRRLRDRLTGELLERQRIEAATNRRSDFLRAMYAYARPSAAAIIDPAMRITDQRCAFIVGRVIAYAIDVVLGVVILAVLAVVIYGLMR